MERLGRQLSKCDWKISKEQPERQAQAPELVLTDPMGERFYLEDTREYPAIWFIPATNSDDKENCATRERVADATWEWGDDKENCATQESDKQNTWEWGDGDKYTCAALDSWDNPEADGGDHPRKWYDGEDVCRVDAAQETDVGQAWMLGEEADGNSISSAHAQPSSAQSVQ